MPKAKAVKAAAKRKVQEIRSLFKQLKMREPHWDTKLQEQWFDDGTHLNGDVEMGEVGVDDHSEHDDVPMMYGVQDSEINSTWVYASWVFLGFTYLLVLATFGIVLWQFIAFEYHSHVIAWTVGAVFVLASVPLTLQDIHMHVINYVSPLQRHYIRILWMIPIYSVESWLALRFNDQKLYLETAREAYEAYVVYSFFKLMREFLGEKQEAVHKLAKVQVLRGRDNAMALLLHEGMEARCSVPYTLFSWCLAVCTHQNFVRDTGHMLGALSPIRGGTLRLG
mmetsp:Transcript_18322/g.28548  ORF Transcript_18322/g.28548 Transcript_18322/m.28548 type:complete len:280 (+) Transcript_18322:150-989(+)